MKPFVAVGLVLIAAFCLLSAGCARSEPPPARTPPDASGETPPAAADLDYVAPGTQAAIDRGVAFLRNTQLPDGGWPALPDGKNGDLGISAVATLGLLKAGVPPADPMVRNTLKFTLGFLKDDGGIHDTKLPNYTTSISVMILKATGDAKYDSIVAKAVAFLKDLQWDEGEGIGHESADFGGTGYGEHKRPDMSNQQWFVQAVREAGLSPDDPAVKKALVFVTRSQGGEEAKWIGLPDGGFIYSPHGQGESKAGKIILPSGQEGLKAYGSMTYAGFLSLIYAGLDRNDKRVRAALEWIQKHWTVEENPELGLQGYYYYLVTMGKALRAYGAPVIVDDKGVEHHWRKELSAKLIALQKEDGSWINDADRWMEGYKPLCTGFALMALDAAKARL